MKKGLTEGDQVREKIGVGVDPGQENTEVNMTEMIHLKETEDSEMVQVGERIGLVLGEDIMWINKITRINPHIEKRNIETNLYIGKEITKTDLHQGKDLQIEEVLLIMTQRTHPGTKGTWKLIREETMTIRVIIIHIKEEEEVFPESPGTGTLGRKMWPRTLHHLHHLSIRAETGAEVGMHLLKERLRVNTLWGTG